MGLDKHVAENRCLDRSGQYRALAGIGGELVEQCVLRTAANNMNYLDLFACYFFQILEDKPIFQRQAFERTTDQGSFRIRRRLVSCAAKLLNRARHIGWI